MCKVKVFNTNTCKYETYKKDLCGRWTKVVKRSKPVCRPVVVCKPVEYYCYY